MAWTFIGIAISGLFVGMSAHQDESSWRFILGFAVCASAIVLGALTIAIGMIVGWRDALRARRLQQMLIKAECSHARKRVRDQLDQRE